MGRAKLLRPKKLGNKLRIVQERLGLSQAAMSDALGFPIIHPTNISGHERGLREPPYPVLLKYARLAGISTDLLIDDKVDFHSNKK